MILGQFLVAVALILTFLNMHESREAGEAAASVRDELSVQIAEELMSTDKGVPGDAEEDLDADGAAAVIQPEEAEGIVLPGEVPPMESYTRMVDGYAYIGIVDVPYLGISLPVMADWDDTRLKISPCRYSGTPYTDDLVIAGHNYPSHFSPLKWVDIGVDVYFTTMDGAQFHYTVSNRETVQPYSVAEMVENENNSDSLRDWDLTLFTCNTGGQTRCAVRCVRKDA